MLKKEDQFRLNVNVKGRFCILHQIVNFFLQKDNLQMENIWLHWIIFCITIPFTLTLFWLWLKLHGSSRFRSKQMIHQNDFEAQSKTDRELTSCQNQFISTKLSNNFIEKMNITTRMDGVNETLTNFKHEISPIHKTPPDIYIVNEKGRKVQYIMCV